MKYIVSVTFPTSEKIYQFRCKFKLQVGEKYYIENETGHDYKKTPVLIKSCIADQTNGKSFDRYQPFEYRTIAKAKLVNQGEEMHEPIVRQVIYNHPATIVHWDDGTKTVVKCDEEDDYDEMTGFLLCFMKKVCGNTGRYNEVLRKQVWNNKDLQYKPDLNDSNLLSNYYLDAAKSPIKFTPNHMP